MTKSTRSSTDTSSSGLAPTAITSADLPGAIVPTSSARSSSLAALTVAALIASHERIPASTRKVNSRAFCPCGPTPMSVPNAIVTPALWERARASLILTPTIIAFSLCAVVNTPSSCAISKTVTPAMIVGTWKAPLAMNSSSERASRKLPCSIESTPASSAALMPAAPCACAAMRRFDDRADFVVGELLVESGLDVGEHATGCHELDRVRTMADLAAHGAATFVDAVANSRGRLHAGANVVAIAVDLGVTACGRENGADAKNPRSRNLLLGNGGPQRENNVRVTDGADVAHGRETGGQCDCRVVRRIETDLGIGIFDPAQSGFSVEL